MDIKSLVDRLPLELRENQRCRELFETIEEAFEQRVGPKIQRILDLRSVFTARPDDLSLKLAELSGYFDEASRELTKPLSIFWKLVELANKNTLKAVEAMLQRINIPPAEVEYVALYCSKTAPYGEVFYSKQELLDAGVDLNDYFLSSHVDLKTDFTKALGYGWNEEELQRVLERYFEENVRPTHIVFRGLKFSVNPVEYPARAVSVAAQRRQVIMSVTV